MVMDFKSCLYSYGNKYYSVAMVEIFLASPMELRVIILGVPIVFILLAYLGITGTNEAINFQNRMWKDEEWRKKNK